MNERQPNQQQSNQQQIKVKVPDEILKGAYANAMQVLHTKEEFVLDFMNLFPPSGIVSARIVLSPGHLKRIISALQENLKRYESAYGSVKEAEAPEHKIGFSAE